ncbi:MAG: hypothetical protein LBR70_00390 [Lactobacillaceae bacterium]|nr:hypothetical protein [Lactobacillaceae bacterium]
MAKETNKAVPKATLESLEEDIKKLKEKDISLEKDIKSFNTKVDEDINEKRNVLKWLGRTLIILGLTAGVLSIIFLLFFDYRTVKLYDENLQYYNNFINSLEVLDNDENVNVGIRYKDLFSKHKTIPEYLKEPEILKQNFLSDYYQTQSNWLNTWLTVLGIIMAVFGGIIPFMFIKFYESKREEISKLCDKIEDMRKEYKEDLDKLLEKTVNLQDEMRSGITSIQTTKDDVIKFAEETIREIKKDVGLAKKSEENAKKSQEKAKESEYVSFVENICFKDDGPKEEVDDALSKINYLLNKKENKESVYLIFLRATLFLKLKDYKACINDYNEIEKIDPGFAYLHNNRGFALIRNKQYKEAIKDLKIALKDKEKNGEVPHKAYINLIRAYMLSENYGEALETLKNYILTSPLNAFIYDEDEALYKEILENKKFNEATEFSKLMQKVKIITRKKFRAE